MTAIQRIQRRSWLLGLICAVSVALAVAPSAGAVETPWFAPSVGSANQVIAVTGAGGSSAKLDVWQRSSAGWQPITIGLPAHIGSAGLTAHAKDNYPATPTGIFSLDSVFGTAPSPGGGLPYLRVGPDDWWDEDTTSPTFNTLQHCAKSQCPFDTSVSENLDIPEYVHAVVIGVNKARIPGDGSGFFVHASDGGPTAGCVSIDDGALVKIIDWLRPGALIAITE